MSPDDVGVDVCRLRSGDSVFLSCDSAVVSCDSAVVSCDLFSGEMEICLGSGLGFVSSWSLGCGGSGSAFLGAGVGCGGSGSAFLGVGCGGSTSDLGPGVGFELCGGSVGLCLGAGLGCGGSGSLCRGTGVGLAAA